MKLQIVILGKYSNPALKQKETPINYILIVSIPEEDWRIITVRRNRRANISHKQNLLLHPALYLQHPIFKLHFLPLLSTDTWEHETCLQASPEPTASTLMKTQKLM